MAGYSKRRLVEKLGIKSGARVLLVNAPRGYRTSLRPLPPRTTFSRSGTFDFIQVFAGSARVLTSRFRGLQKALASDGMLWVSWPKRASEVNTDLDENVVRRIGLALGLVDVKVCAVDDVWSGLKFVVRLKDRAPG